MNKLRWLLFALSIAAGLAIGLYFGWVVSPVEYVDTTPASLRADFRADYTLMVAETFKADRSLQNASRRLANLGSQPPVSIVAEALYFAQQNNYNPVDIQLLQELGLALQNSSNQQAGSKP